MEEPMCLVKLCGKRQVTREVLRLLQRLLQPPMVVVVTVGPYQIGKSTLINTLAGMNRAEEVQALADEHETDLYKTLKEMSPPSSHQTALEVVQAHDMEEPMCLIENKLGGKLQVNQEALQLLQRIQGPVVVVAIVGLYRTGKSYLMNRLAGKDKGGFSLGSTIQANTTGIWMWCLPHPKKYDHTLVLLDTEGLGDVEKSNTENDSWIFALSVLLCSTLVYNSMGTIDQRALEDLQYVTELTKRMKVNANLQRHCEEEPASDDFLWFFPVFFWTVPDFSLDLGLNGKPVSPDEYLENALWRTKAEGVQAPADESESDLHMTLTEMSPPPSSQAALEVVEAHDMEEPMCLTESKPGGKRRFKWEVLQLLEMIRQPLVAIVRPYQMGKSTLINILARMNKGGSPEKLDFPKKYIHEYFPSRKCSVFDQVLRHFEGLPERKLNPDFVEETRRFQSYIYETAQAKAIPGGHTMTGSYSPEKLELDKICIRKFFPCRKCFVFDRPASREGLENLESLSKSSLSPDFVGENFLQRIYDKAEAKVIPGGRVVTETLLGNLAVTYVDAIRRRTVLCLESAMLAFAYIENLAAAQEAIKHYEDISEQFLKLPTETVEELLEVHIQCEREAIRMFMARAFNNEGQEYQKELGETLHGKFQDLCSHNEQASLECCQAVLMELFQDLEDKIASGAYSVPGGYQHFINDQKEKLVAYQQVPGKGLMAFKALQDYLTSKESIALSILMADWYLLDREKEAEALPLAFPSATLP